MRPTLTLTAVPGIATVVPGDDLGALFGDALEAAGLRLEHGDVLAVSQKVVSKAEGRYVALDGVVPSAAALALATQVDKDPRLVTVILSESRAVLRHRPGLIITEHRLGFVMANAGVDQSNVECDDEAPRVLLLPENPDASSARLKRTLEQRFGVTLGVVIGDSAGRAWRNGLVAIALGAAGLPSLHDLRGRVDRNARPLKVTQVALADEIACAAALLMGEADEGLPLVLVRGLSWQAPPMPAAALVRAPARDLFR